MRTFTLAPLLILFVATVNGQQPTPTSMTAVPRLVRISSVYHPANGSAPAGIETVTLAVYSAETGGTALWQETQNVSVDVDGHYALLIGSTRTEGLPVELFAAGEPRWLGVQFQGAGEVEQPRILLASVPYALKAADAETLGGRPASSYLLSPTVDSSGTATNSASTADTAFRTPAKPAPRVAASNYIPMYSDSFGTTMDSVMYQSSDQIGLNTTNPLDYIHVVFTDANGARTGLAVQNTSNSANAYSGMLFYDQNGQLGQFQGFNNSTHEYRINNIASGGSINFMLGSNSKFLVRSDGDVDVPGSMRKAGTLFLHNIGTDSTAVGLGAMPNNTASGNTALGTLALASVTSGRDNLAIGSGALYSNTTGEDNVAIGQQAINNGATTDNNTGIGYQALLNLQVFSNNNTAIGWLAGRNLTSGFNNIYIGNEGISSEFNTIRIGDPGLGSYNTYVQGIYGSSIGTGAIVLVDSSGHLGTTSSSRRYKEDIADMGNASSDLFRLRPVTFRYKKTDPNGFKPLDYGLIAEEVAEIYPGLVLRNKEGQIETVQYQKLTPMLLNELQKQHAQIVEQTEQIQHQDDTIRQQQSEMQELKAKLAGMATLESRLAALESLLSNKLGIIPSPGQ